MEEERKLKVSQYPKVAMVSNCDVAINKVQVMLGCTV